MTINGRDTAIFLALALVFVFLSVAIFAVLTLAELGAHLQDIAGEVREQAKE